MEKALAVSFIVVGVIAFSWAAAMWHHLEGKKGRNWMIFFMFVAGICFGTGVGALDPVGILTIDIGKIPLWVPIVLIIGCVFWLQFRGNKDHRTWTPVLGFFTALIVSLAVGNGLALNAQHEIHNVQVASVTKPAGR